MNTEDQGVRGQIVRAIRAFDNRDLAESSTALLGMLGYRSERTGDPSSNTADAFVADFDRDRRLDPDRAMLDQWASVDLLFQLTDQDVRGAQPSRQGHFIFESGGRIDNAIIESYVFFAIGLRGERYTRTQLAGMTREVNKLFPMPAMVIFKHGRALSLAVINRRLHKRDESRDVLEKVTLIRDIDPARPHRAHVEILFDLSMTELSRKYQVGNFVELHRAWQATLDTAELNRRFFREVANWYFWAVRAVTFPKGAIDDESTRNATSVIRMITRLIFVWFLKEKGLVPDDLFRRHKLSGLLKFEDAKGSTYYKAVLQNLFFATLNQEMDPPGKSAKRAFRNEGQHFNITSLYRYRVLFQDPDSALDLFRTVPFLNGGLFECLDKPDKMEPKSVIRIDGFSDRPDNELAVPDVLFFSEEQPIDLNEVYGTRNKQYRVRGIIDIFDRYKFTVEENTPIEEEIALDPELLGRVFENLLAAYNPETGVTARKQTGSFYTPREIVDYMVDEVLIACFETKLREDGGYADDAERADLNRRIRHLLSYTSEAHRFSEAEARRLIAAIDSVKILDPACGSGAFPMGVLHKLVFVLGKLDPGNRGWRERQIQKAEQIDDSVARETAITEIEEAFANNELDYGRKLYLIENCIYGVDIQPIAVQIAKLRFFISLVVDQRIDDRRPNRGIRPLPNLETKFIAANSLLGIHRSPQLTLRDQRIEEKETELAKVRRSHFTARTPTTKAKWRQRDRELRGEIAALLVDNGWPADATTRLAHWDPYDQNASSDFFDPEWMFGVVEGFDVTLGNPPYVRADSGEAHLAMRKAIEKSGEYETLWEKWDLFVAFIERGFKLLKPGGVTTMIVSDAYCHSKYAQKSQNWFLKNSRILRLDFFSDIQIFDAAVHNMTYLFQRGSDSEVCPERRVHSPEFGAVTYLQTDKQLNLNYRAFFPEEVRSSGPPWPSLTLRDICYVSFGCRPNSDERIARGEFVAADLLSARRDKFHPKPYIEAKDVVRWTYRQTRWLEWGTKRSPSLLARPTFEALYEVPEKIVAADVSGAENRAAYDNASVFHSHTLISVVPWRYVSGIRNNSLKKSARYREENPPRPDLPTREDLEETSAKFAVKYLLAVVNSDVARDFLRGNRRSNIHLYPDDWKKLPIPDAAPEEQAPIVSLVDKILAAKTADPDADVGSLEAEVDRLVRELYGASGSEASRP